VPQAQSFYEKQSGLVWWFVIARIGHGLRERYQLPKEMPSNLEQLVRKLDDRDWSGSWENDVD